MYKRQGINLGYLLTQILGITALLLILSAFVYKPMLRVLDERKARIAKGLEDARQASIARENADMEAKRILDEARAEAATLRREAVVAAEGAGKDVEAKAREDARAIVANAQADATEERNRILADLDVYKRQDQHLRRHAGGLGGGVVAGVWLARPLAHGR